MGLIIAILVSFGLIGGFIYSSGSEKNTSVYVVPTPSPVIMVKPTTTPFPTKKAVAIFPTPNPKVIEKMNTTIEVNLEENNEDSPYLINCKVSDSCGGGVKKMSPEDCVMLTCCKNLNEEYELTTKEICLEWYQEKINRVNANNQAKYEEFIRQREEWRINAYNTCVASAKSSGGIRATADSGATYYVPDYTDKKRLNECYELYGQPYTTPSPSE